MYDPTIGRWLTEDPIGFEAADPNLYRYCGNDATNATDPSGLEAMKLPIPAKPGEVGDEIANALHLPGESMGAAFGPVGMAFGAVGIAGEVIAGLPADRKEWLRRYPTLALTPGRVTIEEAKALRGAGTSVAAETHKFFSAPKKGQFFGTGGCDTCVGMIIKSKANWGVVFHFDVKDFPARTILRYERLLVAQDLDIVLFGGNADYPSRYNFTNALRAAERLRLAARRGGKTVSIKIADTDTVWVGSDGKFYTKPLLPGMK